MSSHSASVKAGNACIDDAVTRYLVTNVLPDRGTVCQPQRSPFDTPAPPRWEAPLPLTF